MSNSAYGRTQHLLLPLYTDSTPMDLRDGYNESMRMIDRKTTQIETLIRERNDQTEQTVKALLGDNTTDSAYAARDKWNKAGTDAIEALADATTAASKADAAASKADAAASKADANTSILTALGADSTVNAAANKTKWDKAGTDATTAISKADTADGKADNNNAILAALGADTTDHATANKTKWDKAATDATTALNAVNTPDKLKDYVVVLGDSWVDGYYGGAKHIDQSPAVAIQGKLSPRRFYYKGSSAGGFAVSGDDGTFADIWDTVPDKNKVTAVIIIGGQNDATGLEQQRTSESVIMSKARELMQTIHAEAPNADIHVCPMVLAVGQTLTKTQNHGADRAHRLAAYRVLTLNLKDLGFGWIHVHEGGYRIGVVASQASDGGDGGDGAHLSRGGYVLAGYWIAHCVAAGIDLWPTNYGGPSDSQISGTWDYVNIYEHDGILSIGFKVIYNAKPNNTARIFKLPKWATIGNPHYYPNFDGKGFVAIDGDTLSIQNADRLDNTGVLVGSYMIPAGM